MNTSSATGHDTEPLHQDAMPWPYAPVRHPGQCGQRSQCWRPRCRAYFGDFKTIEQLDNGVIVAHCHGATYSTELAVNVERRRSLP